MAEKKRSNEGQYFLQMKNFIDLSQNEADRVDSAFDCKPTKKKIHFQEGQRSRITSSEIKRKMSKACEDFKRAFKIAEKPLKQKLPRNFETKNISGNKSDKVSQAGTSEKQDKSLTITINKGTQRRLRTALKLLDLFEGKYSSDSESSMDSESLHGSVKRSTLRLQAMQDLSPRDFLGLCRDCRTRCRGCGRRPSAVLMAKRRRC